MKTVKLLAGLAMMLAAPLLHGANGAADEIYFHGNGGLVEGVSVYTNDVHLSDQVLDGNLIRYRCSLKGLHLTPPDGMRFVGWFNRAEESEGMMQYDGAGIDPVKLLPKTHLYAHWEPEVYTLTYHAYYGCGTGDTISLSATNLVDFTLRKNTFTRTDYIFWGWTTRRIADPVEIEYEDEAVVNGKISDLYGVWKANYHVVFDQGDHGTGKMENQSFAGGEKKPLSPCSFTPEEGYAFQCWHDGLGNKDYTDCAVVGDLMTKPGAFHLKAVWKALDIVKFDPRGGEVDPMQRSVQNGAPYGDLPTPVREGYLFAGWYTAASSGSRIVATSLVAEAGTHTLYAQWNSRDVVVKFDAGEGGRVDPIARAVMFAESYGDLPVPVRNGYTFRGWRDEGGLAIAGTNKVERSETHTLTAVWQAKSITIELDLNGGEGETSVSGDFESPLELPVPERSGYRFDGWFTDDGDRIGTGVFSAPQTLHARWSPQTYRIVFEKGADDATGEMAEQILTYGQSEHLALNAFVRDGYSFCGWLTNGTTSVAYENGEEIELTLPEGGDYPLTAAWEANCYNVDYHVWSGSNITKRVTYGAVYDLPVLNPEREHFTFTGWYTRLSGGMEVKAGTLVTNAANQTLYAHWESKTGEGDGNLLAGDDHLYMEGSTDAEAPAWQSMPGGCLVLESGNQDSHEPATMTLMIDTPFGGTLDFSWMITNKADMVTSPELFAPQERFAFRVGNEPLKEAVQTFNPSWVSEDDDPCYGIWYETKMTVPAGLTSILFSCELDMDRVWQHFDPGFIISVSNIVFQEKKMIEVPASQTFTYNGEAHTGVVESVYYDILSTHPDYGDSTIVATNAYEYGVIVRIKDGYAWADGEGDIDRTISWRIDPALDDLGESALTVSPTRIDFDSNEHQLTVSSNQIPSYVKIDYRLIDSNETVVATKDFSVRDIGQYKFIAQLSSTNNNYVVSPASITTTVEVVEMPAQVTPPCAISNLVYDGILKRGVEQKSGFTLTGNVATNAGDYVAVARLSDGCIWTDGTTEPKTISWAIAKATYDLSKVAVEQNDFPYDGTDRMLTVTGLPNGVWAIYDGNIQSQPGAHRVTIDFFVDEMNWNVPASREETLTIWQYAPPVEPIAESFRYTGSPQTAFAKNAAYVLTGHTATNAGNYTATATLNAGYRWEGGSTEPTNVAWTIGKAAYDLSAIAFPSAEFVADGKAKSLSITGSLPRGVTVAYEENGQTEPGEYRVTAKFTGDEINYEPMTNLTATLVITAPPPGPEPINGFLYDEMTIGAFISEKAAEYNGWLRDDAGAIAGTILVKTSAAKPGKDAKSTITTVIGGKKKTERTTVPTGGNPTDEFGIVYGAYGLSGRYKGYTVEAAKNFAKAKLSAEKDLAGRYPVGTILTSARTPEGTAVFSTTIDKKGKAKTTGYLADGTKISLSPIGALGDSYFVVPVAYAKKAVSFGFVLAVSLLDSSVEVMDISASGWDFDEPTVLALPTDGTFLVKPNLSSAARNYFEEVDGFPLHPSSFVIKNGKIVREKTVGKVKRAKDGSVTVDYKADRQTPANLSALKLTLAAKTGIVTGSFKLYYLLNERLKYDTVKVYGILTAEGLRGTCVIKKLDPFTIDSGN